MRGLDRIEGSQWVREAGWVDLEPDPEILSNKYAFGKSYLIPEPSGRKTVLAELISRKIGETLGTGVLWISSDSVWEYENWELFDGYRGVGRE